MGWVEDTRGVPVAGAVISVFGKGIRGGSLFALSDNQGQFILPSLPAGSYTLRAIGSGHEPSAARRITVLPDRDSLYTVSLTPRRETEPDLAGPPPETEEETGRREWFWLLRHKRRSVLETTAHELPGEEPPAALSLAGSVAPPPEIGGFLGRLELVATSHGPGESLAPAALPAGGRGALQLQGRLADGVMWSLGGLLSENEGRTWRMAAEFMVEPGGGHEIQAGAGYGTALLRSSMVDEAGVGPDRSFGALFLSDHWRLSHWMSASAGARYSYLGFLKDPNHVDAVVQIELRGDPKTLVRCSAGTRTLAPGGDLLTLSTLATSPAVAWATLDRGLRPSRTLRYELALDRSLGSAHLGALAFREDTRDQMLGQFLGADRDLRIRNAGDVGVRGLGFTVGRHFGGLMSGSVTYTFGHARRQGRLPYTTPDGVPLLSLEEAAFHDLVAHLETFIDWTDTRVSAFYRVNTLSDEQPAPPGVGRGAAMTTRFDVQLAQGLPFLQPITRADWEILLAVRNLFYEASEGGFLDELVVQDPPTRVVGGISVRF